MSDSDTTVVRLQGVEKTYKLYSSSKDRLKEALHPLKKTYHRPFHALHGLDLEVKKGEILGIVGRNGSGKSTLLKIIAGVLQSSGGSVHVSGRVSALLELAGGLNADFTGRENSRFMASLQGYRGPEVDEIAEEVIGFAEVGEHIDQPVRSYSTGMKARLAFAINTAISPEILILDEVLSVGDALYRRKAFARIQRMIEDDQTTVLFVSHSEQSVSQICTRAVLLDQGRKIVEGEVKSVIREYYRRLFGSAKPEGAAASTPPAGRQPAQPQAARRQTTHDDRIDTLVSKSRSVIADGPVRIEEIVLRNEDGEQVNVLSAHYRYELAARVRSTVEQGFKWSATIRDVNGIVISGLNGARSSRSFRIGADQAVDLSMAFTASLVAGYYYVSSSLYDLDGNVIYSVADETVVSVRTDRNLAVGYTDLFEPEITQLQLSEPETRSL